MAPPDPGQAHHCSCLNPFSNPRLAQASDLEAPEWATFASGIADLARQREKHPKDFTLFQEWLSQHGPYDVIVDGANVALYGQNFAEGGFSFGQLAQCLDLVQQDLPGAKPLVFLHQARLKHPLAKQPGAALLIQRLQAGHQLYSTPFGSNDDWWVASTCLAAFNPPAGRAPAVFHTLWLFTNLGAWGALGLRFCFAGHQLYSKPYTPCPLHCTTTMGGGPQLALLSWEKPCLKRYVLPSKHCALGLLGAGSAKSSAGSQILAGER